jgi:hypothetical protein
LAESDIGHFTRFTFQREIFAERMIRISFPHDNPTKIRMTGKTNTHHVVHLALVPVGSGPEANHRGYLQMILRDQGLQPEVNVGVQRVKFINDLKPRFITEVIDAGEVRKKIEPKLLFAKSTSSFDLIEGQFQCGFATKVGSPNDVEFFLVLGSGCLEVHEGSPFSAFF